MTRLDPPLSVADPVADPQAIARLLDEAAGPLAGVARALEMQAAPFAGLRDTARAVVAANRRAAEAAAEAERLAAAFGLAGGSDQALAEALGAMDEIAGLVESATAEASTLRAMVSRIGKAAAGITVLAAGAPGNASAGAVHHSAAGIAQDAEVLAATLAEVITRLDDGHPASH
jgi:hypothetical protein